MMHSKELQTFVDQILARQTLPLPGVVVSVARGERLESAFHDRNLSAGRENVEERTRFRYGSFTKVLVAALVCQLVDKGLLALDDEVSRHLPEFTLADVTVRHLLSHTGGLIDLWHYAKTPDEVIAQVVKVGLCSEPGRLFSYSNPGYVVLGRLVERISGLDWVELLRREWLQPLGIDSITNGVETAAFEAQEYYFCQETRELREGALWPDTGMGFDAAGGRLQGTAQDAALIAAAIMTGTVPGNGTRLLSPSMVEQMLTPQAKVPGAGLIGSHWCLGWSLLTGERTSAPVYGHFGGTSVIVAACPRQDMTCAVLTNSPFGTRMGQSLVKHYFGKDPGTPEREPQSVPPHDLTRLVGRYKSETMEVEIRQENGLLLMTNPMDGQFIPLQHLYDLNFCMDFDAMVVDVVFMTASDEERPSLIHFALRALYRVPDQAQAPA
ncbi:hypothetical protein DNK06_02050 [Pseudomonas daroniae]|uniref:Beta-lactamase-related domain-containing protein n=1 Tax=Phytopseudomonas daroniae TaxID=2487519 RepID=A0A4V2KB74_9GAMM|nr:MULTISPECIES: serine hydrolase domain-containing protein [Pseudomonas]TBU83248.1 hypothetical protein DNK06_02050 [Pseudomonas daroniae]TBU84887.1 hypothetical protein DNK31_04430 [Pseudomonas sp. FRB 228]TBU93820.1 hypothetical protein DNJ99_05640 [Pseudomonas daroniae]